MSNTSVLYPIIACLEEARQFIKTDNKWGTVNSQQEIFLKQFYNPSVIDLAKLENVLDNLATKDHIELINFFKERGFEFKIDPFAGNEFGVGSVVKVLVEWLVKHKKVLFRIDGKKYSFVKVKCDNDTNGLSVYSSPKHDNPIVKLETKSGKLVYMTISNPLDGLDLASKAIEFQNNLLEMYLPDEVRFPMVDLEQDVDISWIEKMFVDDWYIAKAEQKTRFKMNHVGAKVESAVNMNLMKCCAHPGRVMVIDKPFLIWISRPGLHLPLFAGYITQEDWKDPGEVK